MNLEDMISSQSKVTNAGGQHYLAFPYTSSVGRAVEELSVNVPIADAEPSVGDKKALFEAVSVQGQLGTWVQRDNGSVWLMPAS